MLILLSSFVCLFFVCDIIILYICLLSSHVFFLHLLSSLFSLLSCSLLDLLSSFFSLLSSFTVFILQSAFFIYCLLRSSFFSLLFSFTVFFLRSSFFSLLSSLCLSCLLSSATLQYSNIFKNINTFSIVQLLLLMLNGRDY